MSEQSSNKIVKKKTSQKWREAILSLFQNRGKDVGVPRY
jgi:hypothetical protein